MYIYNSEVTAVGNTVINEEKVMIKLERACIVQNVIAAHIGTVK